MKFSVMILSALAAISLSACGRDAGSGSIINSNSNDALQGSLASQTDTSYVSLNLTGSPSAIAQAELFVSQGGNNFRIVLGQAVENLLLPSNVVIRGIRFITTCSASTSGGQQSGIQVPFAPALTTQSNMLYSIAFEGSGGCASNPLIKVQGATAAPVSAGSHGTDPTTSGPVAPIGLSGVSDGTLTANSSPNDPPVVGSVLFW